jgi:hypothetical protein
VTPASLIGNFSQEYFKTSPIKNRNEDVYRARQKGGVTARNQKKSVMKTIKKTDLKKIDSVFHFNKNYLDNTGIKRDKKGKILNPNPFNVFYTKKNLRGKKIPIKNTQTKRNKRDVKYTLTGPNANKIHFYSSDGDFTNDKVTKKVIDMRFGDNSLIVIDESQLLVSNIRSAFEKSFRDYIYNSHTGISDKYVNLYRYFIENANRKKIKIIALSGTPIVNRPIELAILFNIISSPDRVIEPPNKENELFDLTRFENEYRILRPADYIPYNYDNDNSDSSNPPEKRENYDKISDLNVIVNSRDDPEPTAQNFKEKVYGYLSYFGNIPNLLPSVELIPGGKIGYNNDGKPLFTIIESVMSVEQINTIINLTILSQLDSNNDLLKNLLSLSKDYVIDVNMELRDRVPRRRDSQNNIIPDYNPREATHNFVENNMTAYHNLISTPTQYIGMDYIENLRNESSKMYDIIKMIDEHKDSKHIVYCESRRISVAFARNLQRYLGYKEFFGTELNAANKSNITDEYKYMFLTGKGEKDDIDKYIKYTNNEGLLQNNKDSTLKEKMIEHFSNQIPGSKFNVVILNSAAAEGITLKKVHYVHFLQVPPNMSRLYQIIGRAIRNCTHHGLTDTKVRPILYLSSGTLSEDQIRNNYNDIQTRVNEILNKNKNKYQSMVQENDNNIPFLRLLKDASIDCNMNKEIEGDKSSLQCYSDVVIERN